MIAKIIAWFRRAKPEPLTVLQAAQNKYAAQFSNDPTVRKAASDAMDRAKGRKS